MPENGRILADFQGQRAYPRASPNVAITFETVLILANTDFGHTPAGPRDAGPTLLDGLPMAHLRPVFLRLGRIYQPSFIHRPIGLAPKHENVSVGTRGVLKSRNEL